MREMLFRGKRIDNGEWVVSSNVFFGGKRKEIYVINPDTDMGAPAYLCRVVDPKTVGQYTGLTDKNGKKIFEGDILHFKAYQGGGFACPLGTDIYYKIIYCEHNLGCNSCTDYIGFMAESKMGNLSSITYLTNSHNAVVIGNIHDNPELLKEGADNV
jgi:uncharacterized phage protein (TIGR01671 family)